MVSVNIKMYNYFDVCIGVAEWMIIIKTLQIASIPTHGRGQSEDSKKRCYEDVCLMGLFHIGNWNS